MNYNNLTYKGGNVESVQNIKSAIINLNKYDNNINKIDENTKKLNETITEISSEVDIALNMKDGDSYGLDLILDGLIKYNNSIYETLKTYTLIEPTNFEVFINELNGTTKIVKSFSSLSSVFDLLINNIQDLIKKSIEIDKLDKINEEKYNDTLRLIYDEIQRTHISITNLNEKIKEYANKFDEHEKKLEMIKNPELIESELVIINHHDFGNKSYTQRINSITFEKLTLHDMKTMMEAFKSLEDIKIQINSDTLKNIKVIEGGNHLDNIKLLKILSDKIQDLLLLTDNTNRDINTFIKTFNKFKQLRLDYSLFVVYITKSLEYYSSGDFVSYLYINRGILTYYDRILNNIITRLNNEDISKDIHYFRTYHSYNVIYLSNFIKHLILRLKSNEIIDISKTGQSYYLGFTIFNHFKDILDIYQQQYMEKLTIYARINDYGSIVEKLFNYDEKNYNELKIDNKICPTVILPEKVKFTEVFDSNNFPDPSAISKYMTLETQLAQGKGVMIMTYGYSGTGKTYTLFGEGKGLLQSTLKNIRGLNRVKIRIYEIYGKGSPYSAYWKDYSQINHEIIHWKINTTTSYEFMIEGIEKIKSRFFRAYGESNNDKYWITIEGGEKIDLYFNNFNSLVDLIDEERKKENRITLTPNNPVSSRSILVYEIRTLTLDGKKEVPFVIVDLPGREEILTTYVDSFIQKPHIQILIKNNRMNNQIINMVLTGVSLYPHLLALIDPVLLVKSFNSLSKEIKESILKIDKPDDFMNDFVDGSGKITFNRLILYSVDGGIFMRDDNRIFVYQLPEEIRTEDSHVIKFFNDVSSHKITRYDRDKKIVTSNNDTIMYEVVVAIALLNRILESKNMEIIKKIKKDFIKKYINEPLKKNLENYNSVEKIMGFMKSIYTVEELLKMNTLTVSKNFKDNYYYDDIETPDEGLYINENIMGIIKFLTEKILKKSSERIIVEQTSNLEYRNLYGKFRKVNEQIYEPFESHTTPTHIKVYHRNNVGISIKEVNNILSELRGDKNEYAYSSKKIFNKKETIFEKLFSIYLDGIEGEFDAIEDFKLFYLFSNNNLFTVDGKDLKCTNQSKLLNETLDFIQLLSSK
jgi:hypothetical protein